MAGRGAQVIEINMSEIKEPILCAPNDPDDARLLSEVQGDAIQEVRRPARAAPTPALPPCVGCQHRVNLDALGIFGCAAVL